MTDTCPAKGAAAERSPAPAVMAAETNARIVRHYRNAGGRGNAPNLPADRVAGQRARGDAPISGNAQEERAAGGTVVMAEPTRTSLRPATGASGARPSVSGGVTPRQRLRRR